MPTPYTPPDPAELALLLEGAAFQQPTQRPILDAYAAGEIGVETTIFRLVQEVRERAPREAAQRLAEASHRAEQARIEAEMAANDTTDSPTFIPVVLAGKPVAQQPDAELLTEPLVAEPTHPTNAEPKVTTDGNAEEGGYDDNDVDTWGTGSNEVDADHEDSYGDDC